MLVAERGVDYHKLDYQGKLDYWQEVKIMTMIIMMPVSMIVMMMMVLKTWIAFRLEENQVGGRRSWSLLLMLRRSLVLLFCHDDHFNQYCGEHPL